MLKALVIASLVLLPSVASANLPAWTCSCRSIGQGMTNVVAGTSTFTSGGGGTSGASSTGTSGTGGSTGTCSNCGDGGHH